MTTIKRIRAVFHRHGHKIHSAKLVCEAVCFASVAVGLHTIEALVSGGLALLCAGVLLAAE